MKFLNKYLFPALTILIILNSPVMAEYVFLKDGSIFTGKIENESPVAITFLKNDGKRIMINPNTILRVLYTELYMGRVYVQKTDGKGLELFMVDEDQEFYTFRYELYQPKEIRIKRTEVLFMARKNPTGLEAVKIDTDQIELKWLPPFNKIKTYKIYYKTKPADKFVSAGNTSSNNFTLKNLKSNTQYFIIVTAVDRDDYESLPSNEIKETTKNIRPFPPKNLKSTKILSPNKKSLQLKVEWDAAIDPDGNIIEYIIYEQDKKDKKILSRTNKTSYDITGLKPDVKRTFYIRAVDNMKDESDNSHKFSTRALYSFDIGVRGFAIFPNIPYGSYFNTGWGLLADFMFSDLLFKGFGFGIETGYFQLTGKAEYPHILRNHLVPVMLALQYRIEILNWLYVDTRISGGYLYNAIEFNTMPDNFSYYDPAGARIILQDSHDGIMFFGVGVGFNATDFLSLSVGGDYGIIFKKDGILDFFTVNLSVIFRINF